MPPGWASAWLSWVPEHSPPGTLPGILYRPRSSSQSLRTWIWWRGGGLGTRRPARGQCIGTGEQRGRRDLEMDGAPRGAAHKYPLRTDQSSGDCLGGSRWKRNSREGEGEHARAQAPRPQECRMTPRSVPGHGDIAETRLLPIQLTQSTTEEPASTRGEAAELHAEEERTGALGARGLCTTKVWT